MNLAVKPDHSLPPFVLGHPSGHHPEVLPPWMESQSRLIWPTGAWPELCSHLLVLQSFVALGVFNGFISIFRLGNAVH